MYISIEQINDSISFSNLDVPVLIQEVEIVLDMECLTLQANNVLDDREKCIMIKERIVDLKLFLYMLRDEL
jgi:hypothetical protein